MKDILKQYKNLIRLVIAALLVFIPRRKNSPFGKICGIPGKS